MEREQDFDRVQAETLGLLAKLYAESNQRDDTIMLDLQEKMTFYGQIYEIMGDLEAFAVGQREMNYAYRKEINAKTFISKVENKGKKLTAKEREAVAELATKPYRVAEARYAEEAAKWRNRRDAVQEQINIMKRRQDGFYNQWNQANLVNGYS